jgi:hypothetical protein
MEINTENKRRFYSDLRRFFFEVFMRKVNWMVALLFTRLCFADPLSDEAEPSPGVSYTYPYFYDETDEASEQKTSSSKKKAKDLSPTAQQVKVGNLKVTVDVENPDLLTEFGAEKEAWRKKHRSEKKEKRSYWDDRKQDEEKERKAEAKIGFEWGAD